MSASPPDVKSIFGRALEIDAPAGRAAYLDGACGGDARLRAEIEALLAHLGQAGAFMNRPAAVDATAGYEAIAEQPGTLVGPYKLMEQIGEGGMGLVFVAEQQQPVRRKVALKVIKPGMDSHDVIARFEAERQALALMDHPNIACILDAGTTESGRPYFVMELVRGVPITDYCDQAQLTPHERLGLFLSVCSAVQHAHHKGIIHRDLKPSNILVTQHDGVPVAKVIDFGVAKALGQQLTDKTIYTRFTQMIGTPLYMSPEQAGMSGLDIDTRGDIFALGVLLYELLTGTTPFDRERLRKAAFDEVRRIIREEEPPRPSTRLSTLGATLSAVSARRRTEPAKLSALVRGDLDWIVMKALEKDRNRRYETAGAFAADLRRFLSEEPVEARPPSALYRLGKLVRRHRRTAVAGGVVFALVAALLVNHFVGYFQLEAARGRAAAEFDRAQLAAAEAQDERDRAVAAEQKARDAAQEASRLATEEKAARDRAEGLRLTAQSELTRPANPGLALLLAVEGARRYTGVLSDNALRAALDACGEERTLSGHGGTVNGAAFSPDGKRLLTCSDDKTARVWDLGTGKEVGRLSGHEGPVLFGAFSPDGRRLVTVSTRPRRGYGSDRDGIKQVRTYDAATLRPLAQWAEPFAEIWAQPFDTKGPPRPYWDRTFAVSFSPDGRRVASTFGIFPGGPPRVHDTDTGKPLLTLDGHADVVSALAFSPDGKRVVTGSLDHTTCVWDAADGKLLHHLDEKDGQPALVVFSPDGKRVLTVSEGWSSEVVKEENRYSRQYKDIPWHGRGVEFTMGRVWEVESGKELAALRWPKGSGALVCTAAFSADGRWVVTASAERLLGDRGSASSGGQGYFPCLWDAATGKLVTSVKPAGADRPQRVHAVAFSPAVRPKGQPPLILVTGEDRAACLWDVSGYRQPDQGFKVTSAVEIGLHGHAGTVTAGAFSADGERVVTVGEDGTARVWDAALGADAEAKKGRWLRVGTALWSPDGGRVFVGGFAAGQEVPVGLWDAATGTKVVSLAGHQDWVGAAAFSRDGKRLITGDRTGTARVWDAVSGTLLNTLSGHQHEVARVAISADGSRAVTATGRDSNDGEVYLWDAAGGTRLADLAGAIGRFRYAHIALSPDGSRLALTCEREEGRVNNPYHLLLFDAATGKRLWQTEQQGERNGTWGALSFSPDGKHILTSCPSEVCLWDAATGKVVRALQAPEDWFSHAAFGPDGRRVVSTSLNKTARVWDVQTGQELATLRGHEGQISSAAFSPDSSLVVTAAWDKTSRLWDARTGKQVATLKDELGAGHAAFSPDGRQVLTYAFGGSARVWPLDPLPVAVRRLPRDFTDLERRLFEIGEGGAAR